MGGLIFEGGFYSSAYGGKFLDSSGREVIGLGRQVFSGTFNFPSCRGLLKLYGARAAIIPRLKGHEQVVR